MKLVKPDQKDNAVGLPSGGTTLVDILQWRALHESDQPAYIYLRDGVTPEHQFTYAAVDRKVRNLASWLQENVEPGDRALLLYPSGLEVVIAFWACLYVGVIAVPAPPPDPVNPKRSLPRLKSILRDADVRCVLTTSKLRESLKPISDEFSIKSSVQWWDTARTPECTGSLTEYHPDADTVAYLQYTSGSTSIPRGVVITHGNVFSHCQSMLAAIRHDEDSRSLCWLPYFHDYGLVHGIVAPLYAGIPAYLMSPASYLREPLRWLGAISRFKITHSGAPNFAYEMCAGLACSGQLPILDLSCWRVASCGAEPIRQETVSAFAEAFSLTGFSAQAFTPAYGLAEHVLLVSAGEGIQFRELDAAELEQGRVVQAQPGLRSRKVISCGAAIPGTRVVIVNPSNGKPCASACVGEVWVSGPSVAKGYWKKDGDTKETFGAQLEGDPARYLRTGDLGFLEHSQLFLTGRLKDLIIIAGKNYYPHDIERTVETSHPLLRPGAGAAFSIIDDNSNERLVTVQEARRGSSEQEVGSIAAAIRQAVWDAYELPVYAIVIIKWGSIYKTSSGKIQRHTCKQAFLEHSLSVIGESFLSDRESFARIGSEETSEEPIDPIEKVLIEIWEHVLGVSRIGRFDNFYECGGHSLFATQVASRIYDTLGVELPLRILFEHPTIAELAEAINRVRGKGESAVYPPIVPAQRGRALALSFSQQRMWFMHQLVPKGTAYNMPLAIKLVGPLNREAFDHALAGIVLCHESFRTTVTLTPDGPKQIIGSPQNPKLVEADLRPYPQEFRQQEAIRLLSEEAGRPFDLVNGPLARFLLIRLKDDEHLVLLHMHHFIGDQWSFVVIGREFTSLYNDFCRGRDSIPKPSVIQYADFAVWERQWLNEQRLQDQLTYWQQRLADLPVLALPTDFPRSQVQQFKGSHRSINLTDRLLKKLTHFSAQEGSTLFMTLLAALQILLSRYTGQYDLAVGVPIANRTRSSMEGIVGTFVNTLVVRTDLTGRPTFKEVLTRVREAAFGAYEHQDLPFEQLVEAMNVKRDLSYSPLVQVLFNVVNAPLGKLEFDGLAWSVYEFDGGAAQFDLTMSVDTELTKKASIIFRTDLFDGVTIEKMLEQYRTLLEAVVADPYRKIEEYEFLSQADRRSILVEWNQTHADYPLTKVLPDLIALQAERTPEAVAVSMEGQTLTYGVMDIRANQLAHYLRRRGVRSGDTIGICLDRSVKNLVTLLGIMKAGAAYLPLDPAYPQERLGYMVEDSGSRIIVTTSDLLDRIPQNRRGLVCLDCEWEEICQEASTMLQSPALEDLAYVIYTSGSTGKPKGVEIFHRSLVNFLWSMRCKPGCSDQDVLLAVTTLSFDIAGLEVYLPLIVGGRVELVRREVAMDGRLLKKCLDEYRPSIMQATPATWRMLIDAGWNGTSHLTALCGGEALPRDLADQILARVGSLWNMYGPTETTIWSAISKVEQGESEIAIGRPIANTELYILDSSLHPVPIGVPGELYIGGDGLARGYRHRPELTAERFIPHPFSERPGARLYKTGDLARYRSDGQVVHLGRLDQQVKIRGFRIEPGEIEATLISHPLVRQAVVTARSDHAGVRQLVAYLIPASCKRPSGHELRAFLRAILPGYMIPSHFTIMEEFPLTANGKINLAALPAPVEEQAVTAGKVAEPRTAIEVQLVALWQQVLGVSNIKLNDDFFELGGHSLIAVQLLALLEQVYGKQLPLATLFQAPTVAQLADVLVASDWTAPWRSLVAIQPVGLGVPFFIVPGVGGNVLTFVQLARLLGPDQPVYGFQTRGLDGKECPFTSVPEMARHYVEEIRSIRPHGPYLIGGACTGGLIAYEIAQQLTEQGESVVLVMMDSWHPTSYRRQRYKLPIGLWLPFFVVLKAWENLKYFMRIPMKGWIPFVKQKFRALTALLWSETAKDSRKTQFQVERVSQATFQAVARYEVREYPGRLLNMIASKRPVSNSTVDTRYAWERCARDGADTVLIPAEDSGLLFTSPNVTETAEHLQRYFASNQVTAVTSHEGHHIDEYPAH